MSELVEFPLMEDVFAPRMVDQLLLPDGVEVINPSSARKTNRFLLSWRACSEALNKDRISSSFSKESRFVSGPVHELST
jgi:hypothetical protein